jgi:RimJ/RimL family protein N-acetyltransferase
MNADVPRRTTLEAAWPIFGLRIQSERLVLRLPTDDDLPRLIDVARAGIHPPDEMPFLVPWSTLPSPDFERGFVQHHWLRRSTWQSSDWVLNLMVEADGEPVGSQSMRAKDFERSRTVETGSWLGRPFQGRGYGKEMRAAILAFAFDGLGAEIAETEATATNARSMGVTRSLGYEPDGRARHVVAGQAVDFVRAWMTAEKWRSRPRASVSVEGLDACRELFGA